MHGTSGPVALEGSGPGAPGVSLTRLLQVAGAGGLLLGYLATAPFFPGHQGREYAMLTAVSVAAALLFIASAMRDTPTRILRILVLAVFALGYYAQFFWLIADPRVEQDLAEVMAANLHPEAMLDVYRETAWVFAALAVVATILDRLRPHRRAPPEVGPAVADRIGRRALAVAVALAAVILPVMAAENVGLMAARGPELPFRLAGWMVYGLRVLVPGLFLLAAAMGERAPGSGLLRPAVVGLVATGAGDMLVTTSKASLVLAFIRILLLLQITGGLSRRRLQLAGLALAGVALLFPFFAALRTARVEGLSGAEAVEVARADRERRSESVLDLLRPAVMRVSGANTLLPLISLEPVPAVAAAGFVGPIGISAYITVVVYGHEPGAPAAEAPGLLGWFHLAGGRHFVVPGVLALLLALEALWRLVWVLPLVSRDVVVALLAGFLLTVIADAVIESMALPLGVIAGTAAVLETLARVTLRAGPKGGPPDAGG